MLAFTICIKGLKIMKTEAKSKSACKCVNGGGVGCVYLLYYCLERYETKFNSFVAQPLARMSDRVV